MKKGLLLVAAVVLLAGGVWLAMSVGRHESPASESGGEIDDEATAAPEPEAERAPRRVLGTGPVRLPVPPDESLGEAPPPTAAQPARPPQPRLPITWKGGTPPLPVRPRVAHDRTREELRRAHAESKERRERLLENATEKLNLSDDEVRQVDRALGALDAQMWKIRESMRDGALPRNQGQAQLSRVRRQTYLTIRETLGPDRTREFQRLRRENQRQP